MFWDGYPIGWSGSLASWWPAALSKDWFNCGAMEQNCQNQSHDNNVCYVNCDHVCCSQGHWHSSLIALEQSQCRTHHPRCALGELSQTRPVHRGQERSASIPSASTQGQSSSAAGALGTAKAGAAAVCDQNSAATWQTGLKTQSSSTGPGRHAGCITSRTIWNQEMLSVQFG